MPNEITDTSHIEQDSRVQPANNNNDTETPLVSPNNEGKVKRKVAKDADSLIKSLVKAKALNAIEKSSQNDTTNLFSLTEVEPDCLTLKEAREGDYWPKWKDAINKELKSLEANNTWTITELPPGKKQIGCRYVLKKKRNAKGEVERYKARLVAQGYTQKKESTFTKRSPQSCNLILYYYY